MALAFAAPAAAQSSEALLAQFRGEVTVHPVDDGPVAARVGLRLARGDSVHVPAGGRAVILFSNGRLVTASSPVTVGPPGTPGAAAIYAPAARAAEAARGQGPPETSLGVGRPYPAGARPLSPVAGSSVVSTRPTLEWAPDPDAEEYLVQIRPVAGGSPVRFTVRGAERLEYPDSATALEPGAEYSWLVVGVPGGRPPGEERFRVLDPEGREALEAFRAALADSGLDPDSEGLFLSASFYAELGLLHEALGALDRLDAGTPAERQDPVVGLLRTRVLEQLGRTEEAAEAYRRATSGG